MPGENGRAVLQDRSEPEDQELNEVERGRLLDDERKSTREQRKVELDAELKRDGRMLDVMAAFKRSIG